MIRFFDILFSIFGLLVFLPIFLILAFLVQITSSGGIFYVQERVGLRHKNFNLIKFRTMFVDSDTKGLLTIKNDSRITLIGRFLRRYKLDELPQLINILKGEMSFVGPRPEVPKYVKLFPAEMERVLSVRPGLTDFASIFFIQENDLLFFSNNPEETYIKEIIPKKIELNDIFIESPTLSNYFRVILLTIKKIIIN